MRSKRGKQQEEEEVTKKEHEEEEVQDEQVGRKTRSKVAASGEGSKEEAPPVRNDDAPEVVTSSSSSYKEEMLKLQQLHEMMSANKKKVSKKKRKIRQINQRAQLETDEDAELDVSIFKEVEQHQANDGHEDVRDVKEHQQANQRIKFSDIDESSSEVTSKDIGHISVNILSGGGDAEGRRPNASSALASFGRPSKSIEFLESYNQNIPRTRFAIFAGQKSIGPAKKFCLK